MILAPLSLVQRASYCHRAYRSENSAARFPRLALLMRRYFDNEGLHLDWHLMRGNFWVSLSFDFRFISSARSLPVRMIHRSELRIEERLLRIVGLHSFERRCLWSRRRVNLSPEARFSIFGLSLGRWPHFFFFVIEGYIGLSTSKCLENLLLLLIAEFTVFQN